MKEVQKRGEIVKMQKFKNFIIGLFAVIGVISVCLCVGYILGTMNKDTGKIDYSGNGAVVDSGLEPTATDIPTSTPTVTPTPEPELTEPTATSTPTPTVAPTATATPSPTPTATSTPKETPTPTPQQEEKYRIYDSKGNQCTIIRYAEKDWKTVYSTANARTRVGPSTEFEQVAIIYEGDQATLIGECVETGWSLIKRGNQEMWITSAFLTEEAPATPTPTPTKTPTTVTPTPTSSDNNTSDNNDASDTTTNSSSSNSSYDDYYTAGRYTIGIKYYDTEAKVTVNGTTYTIPLQVEEGEKFEVNSKAEQAAWRAIYPDCGWELGWDDDSKGYVIPDQGNGGPYIGSGIEFN